MLKAGDRLEMEFSVKVGFTVPSDPEDRTAHEMITFIQEGLRKAIATEDDMAREDVKPAVSVDVRTVTVTPSRTVQTDQTS